MNKKVQYMTIETATEETTEAHNTLMIFLAAFKCSCVYAFGTAELYGLKGEGDKKEAYPGDQASANDVL